MKVILPSLVIASGRGLLRANGAGAVKLCAACHDATEFDICQHRNPRRTGGRTDSLPAAAADRGFQLPDAQPATPPGDPEGADLLVDRATAALAKDASIAARIRYQVEMFGHHLVGKGSYLQQGLGLERKMRLELETPIGDQSLVLEANLRWPISVAISTTHCPREAKHA